MKFASKIVALCAVMAVLGAALLLGDIFSPQRVQARTTGRPLLGALSPKSIEGMDIVYKGTSLASLRLTTAGWEATSGSRTYPASVERISLFLRIMGGLRQGRLASADSAQFPELGLGEEAHRLVLHAGQGGSLELLVGKRGPSGDEDYVLSSGTAAAYLVRGSLSFFLAQNPSYWYELHALPLEVEGASIESIRVSGSLELAGPPAASLGGSYTLLREKGPKGERWSLQGEAEGANQLAAGAMANSLAQLEGELFAEAAPAGHPRLVVDLKTRDGKNYSLSLWPGQVPGETLVTASWSPWTYIVADLPLRRAIPRAAGLR